MAYLTESHSPLLGRFLSFSALSGILVGITIGFYNGDPFGWTLLRSAVLGLFFFLALRHFIRCVLRFWLESKLEALIPKKEAPAAANTTKARAS